MSLVPTPLVPTIGLEVHCQLKTQSKLFCGCPVRQGQRVNTDICPVCMGYPGALPVLNAGAIELAVRAGLALGCTVHAQSEFTRKHYFYPDLPKGFQISQFDQPICTGGQVHIELGGVRQVFQLERIHIEEDAGKMRHTRDYSSVDWNRAGTPLIEIVGKPDLHSAEAAGAWMRTLHRVMVAAGVSTGDMEKGHFRCDANVSVAPKNGPLGTRVELKNINSFRYVERAIRGEIERQVAAINTGKRVVMSTRSWTGSETILLRIKEDAADYRYFPEPDLPPLVVSEAERLQAVAALPGRPLDVHLLDSDKARLVAFVQKYTVRQVDALALFGQPENHALFEAAVSAGGEASAMMKWMLGPIAAWRKQSTGPCKLNSTHVVALETMVVDGEISRATARTLLPQIADTGVEPAELVVTQALQQVDDTSIISETITSVLAAESDAVARYQDGNKKVFGFLMGAVMRAFKGQADAVQVRTLLAEALAHIPHKNPT